MKFEINQERKIGKEGERKERDRGKEGGKKRKKEKEKEKKTLYKFRETFDKMFYLGPHFL